MSCRLSYSVLCPLVIFIFACGHGVKQYVRPNVDMGMIKRVAVLPLENFTADNFAGGKVRSKVNIELLSRGIDVIEPGEVVTALRALKVRSLDSIKVEDIKNIGQELDVDAVITGSVESFRVSKGITVSYPEVSIHLMLFETSTGNIIWSAWHTTGGASFWTRHFGAEGSTVDKASEKVVKEAFDTLF